MEKIDYMRYQTNIVTTRLLRELEQTDWTTILGKENAKIDAKYICPHHPDSGFPEENKAFKVDCDCRKPKPGLFKQAGDDHNIDFPNEKFVIIRFVAWGAIHDIGQSGLDLNCKFELVESLSKFAKVPIISKKLFNVLVHNNG